MYSRELDGEVLTLSASGWTYNFTFVLFDYETETLWYHIGESLQGIGGEHAGRTLSVQAIHRERWDIWKDGHPDTLYMISQ